VSTRSSVTRLSPEQAMHHFAKVKKYKDGASQAVKQAGPSAILG